MTCIDCGQPCQPTPVHPGVLSERCPDCQRVERERALIYGLPERLPEVTARRAEDI